MTFTPGLFVQIAGSPDCRSAKSFSARVLRTAALILVGYGISAVSD